MKPRQFKQFIDQAASLSRRQRVDLADVLNRGLRQEQTAATIEAAGVPRACPPCRSLRLHRDGHADGLQRYRCVGCARSFNALTGTPPARLRHRTKWLLYLDCMMQSGTVRRAAALVGVHKNTSFRWRHRFLTSTKHDRTCHWKASPRLTKPTCWKRKRDHATWTARRAGVARRRGLSHEHDCILVARDRTGRTIDFVKGRAPLKPAHLQRCLPPVVAPDVMLVTDGHPAYPVFARKAGISHRAVNLPAGVRVAGALHVQNVNAYHGRFKQWLRRFHGVASHYLPNYLGVALGARRRSDRFAGMLLRSALGAVPDFTVT